MDFEEVMEALDDANFSIMDITYQGRGLTPDINRPVSDWLDDLEIYSSNPYNNIFALMWDPKSKSFVVVCADQMLHDWYTVIPCHPDNSYGALSVEECRHLIEGLENSISQAEAFTNAVQPYV